MALELEMATKPVANRLYEHLVAGTRVWLSHEAPPTACPESSEKGQAAASRTFHSRETRISRLGLPRSPWGSRM